MSRLNPKERRKKSLFHLMCQSHVRPTLMQHWVKFWKSRMYISLETIQEAKNLALINRLKYR